MPKGLREIRNRIKSVKSTGQITRAMQLVASSKMKRAQDAARARGMPPRRIIWRHVARNALLPVVTMLGLQSASMLGGSVVIESVFSIPGIGRLAFESVVNRDLNTLLGIVFMSALLVITVSFLPIFTLAGQAGRLFTPLAYTKTFAMFAAAVLSITLAPPGMITTPRPTTSVGTGQNMPISASALQSVLGSGAVQDLASRLGVSQDAAGAHLAELLPGIVDHLTPNGEMPQGGLESAGMDLVKGLLSRTLGF